MKSQQRPPSFARRVTIHMVGCSFFSVYLGILLSRHEQIRIMWEPQPILEFLHCYTCMESKIITCTTEKKKVK